MTTGRKSLDAIWTRIAIDPVADRLAGWLRRFDRITPNRVTVLAGLLALAAAAAFLWGWYALGGVLFQLRFLVDCVDGRLARLRGTTSSWGAALDVFVDTAGVLLCFAALGSSVVAEDAAGPVLPALVLTGCGLYSWTLGYRKSLAGGGQRDWLATGASVSAGAGLRSRWVAAMAGRGMVPTPYAVELELLTLTLLPLTGSALACVLGLWIAVLFYAAATALNVLRIRRLTVRADLQEDS